MNDNTRRQWERYCAEHPELSGTERAVLYWLVHMHSASEGFTRPGVRRLAQCSGLHTETVVRVLATFADRGTLAVHRPARGRLAAEYVVPWLHNPMPVARGNPRTNGQVTDDLARGNTDGNPRGNPRTSSPYGRERNDDASPPVGVDVVATNSNGPPAAAAGAPDGSGATYREDCPTCLAAAWLEDDAGGVTKCPTCHGRSRTAHEGERR